LITTRYLVRAAGLRENADVDMFDIGPGHAQGNQILGLTRSRTRVTANTTGLVDHLGPLHRPLDLKESLFDGHPPLLFAEMVAKSNRVATIHRRASADY
jgi:hypothetical protein